jgi:amino acid transporter
LVSSAGLFSAQLLAYSRLPFVLAADGFLPPAITRLHPKFGTPWIAILLCAVLYSFFTLQAFKNLIVIDVTIYTVALLLEFVALIVLRVRRPELPRPFRVAGGLPVAVLMGLLPAGILGFAIYSRIAENGWKAIGWAFVALATGPIYYVFARRFRPTR